MGSSFYVPQKAMFVAAHPDDIEFGAAGTAARWVQAGAEIVYVLCTSGDVGIADAEMTREKAAAIREAEQLAAAKMVGVQDVVFLREPDGLLENTLDLRKKLVREVRRFQPEVVVTLDPTVYFAAENYINHPDHRAAAAATLDAVFPAAGQPHVFQELEGEGFKAHKVRKVYVDTFGRAKDAENVVYVNTTGTIDLKIQALRCHTSQLGEWDPEPMMREWAAATAKGLEMEYAECFRVFTLVSDEDYAKKMSEGTSS